MPNKPNTIHSKYSKKKIILLIPLFVFFAVIQLNRIFSKEGESYLGEHWNTLMISLVFLSGITALFIYIIRKRTIQTYLKQGLSELHPANQYWIEGETIRSEVDNTENIKKTEDIKSAAFFDSPYKKKFNLDKVMVLTFNNAETWKLRGSDRGFEDILKWVKEKKIPLAHKTIR